ncbi:MAG: ribonuclease III domain-containing protein, partial [Desulfurobacteriaceae bacterium]
MLSSKEDLNFVQEDKLVELERRLNYTFKDKDLLKKALIHRSFAFEKDLKDNYEVLEFLGDAVIGLIVSEELIKRFPDKREGELSQIRAFLV